MFLCAGQDTILTWVERRFGFAVVLAAARQVIDCPPPVVRARAPGQRAPQWNDS
jgi:hypothetical protein